MKWIGAVAVFAVASATLACKRAPEPYPTSFNEGGVPVQNRISQYFRDSVAPALRGCWGQLQGDGAVAMDVTYRKNGDKWTFEKVTVTNSTLAQDAVAAQCTEQSIRGTAFAVEPREALENAAQQFVVRLGVPVPLPAAGTQTSPEEIARMLGSTSGGGDIPGCSECVSNPEYPYGGKCEAKKSGGHLDCRSQSPNVCSTSPTACLRGAFGGLSVVMY